MPTLAELLREQRRQMDSREDEAVGRITSIYDAVERDIQQRLHHVNWLIDDARRTGGPVKPSWLHQQTRYRILLAEIERIEQLYLVRADTAMFDARLAEVRAGAMDAMERAGVMGPRTGFATVNTQAVESMMAQLSIESPVTKLLRQYGEERAQAIEASLLRGIGNGDGAEAIVRDIMRQIGEVTPPWKIRTLVRTEGMRAYRESQYDQYENIPEVAGFVWVAARSSRTCAACLALDGKVFKTRGDIPGSHPNCRCSCAPEPRKMYPSVRKYLNQRGTGEEWLRRQSPEAIRKHFPSERAYQAFMSGEVGLSDFIGYTHSPVWGRSVTQLSARQVLGA